MSVSLTEKNLLKCYALLPANTPLASHHDTRRTFIFPKNSSWKLYPFVSPNEARTNTKTDSSEVIPCVGSKEKCFETLLAMLY